LRHRIVQVLDVYQPPYVETDVAIMDELIAELDRAFPSGREVIQAKGLLGSRKDRWLCRYCEHRNDLADERCGKCSRDALGFLVNEITPARAMASLRERRRALSGLF
jgi:hypothetical protein